MTVDNNISNLGAVQTNLLEKISSGNAINKASDDASGLLIADQLQVRENSLTQSLVNANQGIAFTQIAIAGIDNQKEILENIKQEALKAKNGTLSEDDKQNIQNQIEKYIENFDYIADTTKYNDEKLLQTTGGVEDDLSIVGDNDTINIEKSDSKSISDSLKKFLSDFASNPAFIDGMIQAADEGINSLNKNASEFASASNALESMARNYISASSNTAEAKSTILDADTFKNVSDFSKNNVMSQVGYLAQSQANAVQSRTVSLLT
jgi:flagellin